MAYDHFPLCKIHSSKNILFVGIQIGKYWHVFSIRKSIRIPRAIVKHLHPGLLQCKITVYFNLLSNVLKPDKLEWAFKRKIFIIVLTFEWTSFEPIGIYDHRVNKQNVHRYYLGTEYSKTMPTVFSMDCQKCTIQMLQLLQNRDAKLVRKSIDSSKESPKHLNWFYRIKLKII